MNDNPIHPKSTVVVHGATDVGRARDHNEDAFAIVDMSSGPLIAPDAETTVALAQEGLFLAVYDGMGGHAAGEVAAAMAAKSIERDLRRMVSDGRTDPAEALRESLRAANQEILAESQRRDCKPGMGTTSTAALLFADRAVFAEVGDSRAYLLRGGTLTQLTHDQSLVATMLEAGLLTAEEAKSFPHTNVILQALGVQEKLDPVATEVQTQPGDLILLCSDGLHGPVPDQDIAAILRREPTLTDCAEALIQAALDAGGPDNVTVVLARYEQDRAYAAMTTSADAGAVRDISQLPD